MPRLGMGRDDGDSVDGVVEMSGENDDFLSQMMSTEKTETEQVESAEVPASPMVEKVQESVDPVAKVVPTATESEADKHVPLAALMAERDKRKESSRRVEELERRLKEIEQSQVRAAPPQMPDFFQDPEGYVHSAVSMARAEARDGMLAALEEAERDRHQDFDDVLAHVMERAQSNPELARRIMTSRNPAAQAYKLGKELVEFDRIQTDPESYRTKLEAELREKILKELETDKIKRQIASEKEQQLEASIPPDLSSERSANSAASRPRNKSTAIDKLFPKS